MAISKDLAEMSLDGFSSESGSGAKVYLEDTGSLTWPVLFLYPEHGQTDFISAFHEESRLIFLKAQNSILNCRSSLYDFFHSPTLEWFMPVIYRGMSLYCWPAVHVEVE